LCHVKAKKKTLISILYPNTKSRTFLLTRQIEKVAKHASHSLHYAKLDRTEIFRKMGKNKIIPIKENINPPIVPAANGYQKASFVEPTINGLKPRTVEVIVSIIGRIFTLQALT
jgi:hypothetical protein